MTVKQLKEELSFYDDDMKIVFEVDDEFEPESITEDKWGHMTVLKPKELICRCKDCKHMELKDFVYGTCKYRIGTVKPDGFCERGERK